MAGAKSGISGVHIALIIFVMLTIILGTTTYLFYDDYRTAQKAADDAKGERDAQLAAARTRADEVAALAGAIGTASKEDVGLKDPTAQTTMLGEINRTLQAYGAPLQPGQPNTLINHLQQLRAMLDEATTAQNRLQQQVTEKQDQLLTLFDTQYKDQLQKYRTDATARETDLRNVEASNAEQLNAAKSQVAQLQAEYQKSLADYDALEQRFTEESQRLNEEIASLRSQATELAQQIKDLTRSSFDRPLGEIVMVASDSKAVWINLGSADGLQPGISFSVYAKNATGANFGPEDAKGTIEVTSIEAPHRAQARVTSDQLDRPIARGDAIFTPVWRPNSSQHFAVVGLIDFDRDGKSDRADLHNLIKNAGGTILTEVDDTGERTGGSIDERVKFLIVGRIPSLDEAVTDDEREAYKQVQEWRKKMIDEADVQGVRVITLEDFLAMMGHVIRTRTWEPGSLAPYTLESGAADAVVDEIAEKRGTSGLYSTRGRRMGVQSQQGSSNLYRGGANGSGGAQQ